MMPNGLNEAFIVTRRLPVAAPPEVVGVLSTLDGVDHAEVDGQRRLVVRYDSSRIGFGAIEGVLREGGVVLPDSLLWRLRAEWFRFTDGNAHANAHATHACCSRPPVAPGVRDRK